MNMGLIESRGVFAVGGPGQGWQEPGMGKDLLIRKSVQGVLAEARDVFRFDVEELCRVGETGRGITLETHSQAAMGTVMIAGMEDLVVRHPQLNEACDFSVSLGVYGEYYRAGILDRPNVFRALKVREEMTLAQQDGAMAFVMGIPRETFKNEFANGTDASIAVQYADADFAFAGSKMDVAEVLDRISIRRGEFKRVRALALPIPNSFHHPLLTRIEGEFASFLGTQIEFHLPVRPVILNTGYADTDGREFVRVVTASTEYAIEILRAELSMQLTQPARFDLVHNRLLEFGVTEVIEASSGALAKVFRRLGSPIAPVTPAWEYGMED
jgi:malonyl CoA-acyl carrier protein transacylase